MSLGVLTCGLSSEADAPRHDPIFGPYRSLSHIGRVFDGPQGRSRVDANLESHTPEEVIDDVFSVNRQRTDRARVEGPESSVGSNRGSGVPSLGPLET